MHREIRLQLRGSPRSRAIRVISVGRERPISDIIISVLVGETETDHTSDGVAEVIVAVGSVINGVAATARHPTLESAELGQQLGVVEQLKPRGIDHRLTMAAMRRRRSNLGLKVCATVGASRAATWRTGLKSVTTTGIRAMATIASA